MINFKLKVFAPAILFTSVVLYALYACYIVQARPVQDKRPADQFLLACTYESEIMYAVLDTAVPSQDELEEFGPGTDCAVYNLAQCQALMHYIIPVVREDGATYENGEWAHP